MVPLNFINEELVSLVESFVRQSKPQGADEFMESFRNEIWNDGGQYRAMLKIYLENYTIDLEPMERAARCAAHFQRYLDERGAAAPEDELEAAPEIDDFSTDDEDLDVDYYPVSSSSSDSDEEEHEDGLMVELEGAHGAAQLLYYVRNQSSDNGCLDGEISEDEPIR